MRADVIIKLEQRYPHSAYVWKKVQFLALIWEILSCNWQSSVKVEGKLGEAGFVSVEGVGLSY